MRLCNTESVLYYSEFAQCSGMKVVNVEDVSTRSSSDSLCFYKPRTRRCCSCATAGNKRKTETSSFPRGCVSREAFYKRIASDFNRWWIRRWNAKRKRNRPKSAEIQDFVCPRMCRAAVSLALHPVFVNDSAFYHHVPDNNTLIK